MSEDEIIKIIKEYLSKIYIECTKVGAVGIPNEEWYAIKGLLDLYQKEKEKNRLLIEGKFREVADKNSYIKDNYISKDKIKEKIKQLEKIQEEEPDAYLVILYFKKLLGE